jgi:hypothetical protein
MVPNQQSIDLYEFRGQKSTTFTGRPQGEQAREKLKLDALDKDGSVREIHLRIPAGTTSFNPSFYLGLLFKSIERLGVEQFQHRYKLDVADENPELQRILRNNINDGFRNALNTIQGEKRNWILW